MEMRLIVMNMWIECYSDVMSAQSIAASHRLIADNPNLLAANSRTNHLLDNVLHNKQEDHNTIKCKNIIMNNINNNVNESNPMNSSSSKNGSHCGLNINSMFAMPFNSKTFKTLFSHFFSLFLSLRRHGLKIGIRHCFHIFSLYFSPIIYSFSQNFVLFPIFGHISKQVFLGFIIWSHFW